MSKKYTLATLLILFSTLATSDPMRYTFTGSITSFTDSAGAVAAADIDVGDPVEYVYLIDPDLDGQVTRNDGSILYKEDEITEDGVVIDYFFDDLISGSLIDEVDGGSYNDPDLGASLNFGQESVAPGYNGNTILAGGSSNNNVLISSNAKLAEWVETSSLPPNGGIVVFNAFEYAYDSDNNYSLVRSNLYLSDISPVIQPVSIDIKPRKDRNKINPDSKKRVTVAVLGSIDFDATQIDFNTVTFGPAGASPIQDGRVRDVNKDGFPDIKFHFKISEIGIACGETEAGLKGQIFSGRQFEGTDTVKTIKCD